jgi:hypothetical protein
MLEGIFGKKFDSEEYEKAKEDAETKDKHYTYMGSLDGVPANQKQAVYDAASGEMVEAKQKVKKLQEVADKEVTATTKEYKEKRAELVQSLDHLWQFRKLEIASPISINGAEQEKMDSLLKLIDELFPR